MPKKIIIKFMKKKKTDIENTGNIVLLPAKNYYHGPIPKKHSAKIKENTYYYRTKGQRKNQTGLLQSRNLIIPLVEDILSDGLAGTTCVLTKTNEEALQVTGLLLKNGLQAKLIQSNEGFSLSSLLEIRCFLSRLNLTEDVYTISDDVWAEAKRKLSERFGSSLNLDLCLNLINDFEATNPRNKYKSDLDIFIRESKLEDLFGENSETIFVSTIHKAKGREFDNVFQMLDQFNSRTDEAKRQLYVAMTRAKRSLTIHYMELIWIP